MGNFFGKIRHSLSSLAWGLQVLSRPWARRYLFLAILLNVLAFVLALVLFFGVLQAILTTIGSQLGANGVVLALLQVISFLLSLLLLYVSFSAISLAVAAPVYGNLAEALLVRAGVPAAAPQDHSDQGFAAGLRRLWRQVVWPIVDSLAYEAKKLLLLLAILLLSLPLHLLPGVGQTLYVTLNFAAILTLTGLDLFAPAHAREGLRFRDRILMIWRRPVAYLPFLTVATLLGAIPILNLFTIPVFCVGALRLYYWTEYKLELSS